MSLQRKTPLAGGVQERPGDVKSHDLTVAQDEPGGKLGQKEALGAVPESLREMAIWHPWRATDRGNGKIGKPPLNRAGRLAKAEDHPMPWMMLWGG